MPFDSALPSGDYDKLRGTSSVAPRFEAEIYLSVCQNEVIYSARINQATFTFPAFDLTIDGGSGTVGDVRPGMTVLISHTNDATAAYFRGFVWDAWTSTNASINESGADFADNDYVWVINDFEIWPILPVDVAEKPVPHGDLAFRELKPIIAGLPSAIAGLVDPITEVLEYELVPAPVAAASGTTIDTHLWEVPAGVTISVGSDTSENITVEIDPGVDDWIHYTVTDDAGVSNTFHIKVWAHDADNPPSPLQFESLSIQDEIPIAVNEGAGSGYSASVTVYGGVTNILDDTLVCAWVRQKYNGTETNIGSAGNVLIVGRFRNEQNTTAYQYENGVPAQVAAVQFTIEGALTQLSRLGAVPLEILTDAAPDEFNQVENLTVWRAAWLVLSEYSTFGSLHALAFDSTSDAFLYPGFVTQGGDSLYAVADLLQGINALIQENGAGMSEVARRVNMLSGRSGVVVVANMGEQDYYEIEYSRTYFQQIGKLKGAGGGYDSALDVTTGYEVRAPRGVPEVGAGEAQLYRQILEADQTADDTKAELAQRAGDGFAAERSPDTLIVSLHDGWHWLTPDCKARYTWTIAADDTVRGKTFDTSVYWWLQSISKVYNPQSGIVESVRAVFVRETDGIDGEVIELPAVDVGEYPFDLGTFELPDLPPTTNLDTETDIGDWTPNDGATIDSDCADGRHRIDSIYDIGSVKTIKSVTITYTATATQTGNRNKLLLRTEGSFFYVYASWNTLVGTNTVTLNVGGVPAQYIQILAYGDYTGCGDTISITDVSYASVDNARWQYTFDFLASDGGWTPNDVEDYTASVGWEDDDSYDGGALIWYRNVYIKRSTAAFAMTRLVATYTVTRGTFENPDPDTAFDQLHSPYGTVLEDVEATDSGTLTLEWDGSLTGVTEIGALVRVSNNSAEGAGGGTGVITRVVVEGAGFNPFV
jgi:hypothetical protein